MAEKCGICGEVDLSRPGIKYCGHCSYIFFNLKNQRRFEGTKTEVIEAAVKEKRKEKGRSPCGRKPLYLKTKMPEAPAMAGVPAI